jgi:hypothetical protein
LTRGPGVAGALRVHAEAADLDAVAEHLPEDALEVLLHLAETRDAGGAAERRGGIEEAGDGEPLLDLRDLGLGLHILDRAQRFAGVRVPDLFALGGIDLEDHALAHAVRAPAVMTISPLPIIFATLPSTAMRYNSLCCSLPKNYARIISLANAPSRASYNPSHERKTDDGSERAHEPGGEAPADL